jgi:hypothetical protein
VAIGLPIHCCPSDEHPDCQRRPIYFVNFETAWILPLALSSYSVSLSTYILWQIHVFPDFSAPFV